MKDLSITGLQDGTSQDLRAMHTPSLSPRDKGDLIGVSGRSLAKNIASGLQGT